MKADKRDNSLLLAVYQGLGVPEVLIYENKQLTLYNLRGVSYQESAHDQFFPDLDLQLLARYIRPQEQPQAVKEFIHALGTKKSS